MRFALTALAMLLLSPALSNGQELAPTVAWCPQLDTPPLAYGCPRVTSPPKIDGQLDDLAWAVSRWTDKFVDIEGGKRATPRFSTRIKMAWDDAAWYIAARLEEPHVWGDLTRHDSVIFHNNDFELFVDPDGDSHRYGELELNALNTTWDLFLDKPYKDGGKADNGWEIEGLRTAVHVDGTLNDPTDTDRGWSIEIAIPFRSLERLGVSGPPAIGDVWRVDFSRVQWRHQIVKGKYQRTPKTREDNWVWSPQGVINMHRPETWGYLVFQSDSAQPKPHPDRFVSWKRWLHQVYYQQKARKARGGEYAAQLADLDLDPPPAGAQTRVLPKDGGYTAQIEKNGRRLSIRQDGKVIGP